MLSSGTMSPRRTMSQPWSEKNGAGTYAHGLPLPSSSKRARPLSLPARMKRRWPVVLALAIASLIAMSYFSTASGQGLNDSRGWYRSNSKSTTAIQLAAQAQPGRVGQPGSADGYEQVLNDVNEEEVMAKDDLYVQGLEDSSARTPEQVEEEEATERANAKAEKEREEKAAEDRRQKLRALVWWVARGGQFPNDYRIPSAGTLAKMTQKAWTDLLADVEGTDANVFLDGWEDEADLAQRVTVFSKTFCPFSMRAKAILKEYPIHPDPFIVELDQRDDTSTVQDLLLHLTGRRTVPNVIIRFESIGGADETQLLHHEGGLQRRLSISEPEFHDWN